MSWLLLDMGNSRCKVMETDPQEFKSLGSWDWFNQDFDEEHWLKHFRLIKNETSLIEKIVVSSVSSDAIQNLIVKWVENVFDIEVEFACSQDLYANQSRDLVNSYAEPLALGVDRWLAMVGAFERTNKAFAVIDAGTAITLDLVDAEGKHLGGHIVPGANLMQKALFGDTGKIAYGANLDKSPTENGNWLGQNSLQAVELGTLQAAQGYLQSCLERLIEHYGIEEVYVCGGDGAALLEQIQLPINLSWIDCSNLVLEGLFYHTRNA